MGLLKDFLLLLLYQLPLIKLATQTAVQTHTISGTVEGSLENVEGTWIEVYKGIPYAEPPLETRRFKKPIKKKPWTGVLDTKMHKYSCMQGESDRQLQNTSSTPQESEDCLTLNIWNPSNKTDNATVMVFIHGGRFVRGSSVAAKYDAAILAASGNVIVVSLNYRLGVFGFLYLDESFARGNQGLLDQKMAIEWIKENIGFFGGDSSSITLFGQSAGGSSVTAHLLSPASRELFKRAIVQSGTVNIPGLWLKPKESKRFAWRIIKAAGCQRGNKRRSVKCLRKVKASTLALLQMAQYSGPVLPFVPTIDGVFLPDYPLDMLANGDYGSQDILIGNVRDEGTFVVADDPSGIFNDQHVIPIPRLILHGLYDALVPDMNNNQKMAVKYEYTDWEMDISLKNQLLLADAVGDRTIVCPCVDFAKHFYMKNNKVYYYLFTQRTSSLSVGEWMGVPHEAEVEYVLGFPRDPNNNYTPQERNLSATIMRYFTDFAKYGNPAPVANDWPLYTKYNPEYVILNAEEQGTGIGPKPTQCALWNWLLPALE